jgi:hypothetical protein
MVEQLAFRRYLNRFEVFVTFPDTMGDGFLLPNFGQVLLKNGLMMDDDDEWEWRVIKKTTVKKLTGKQLIGSDSVLHLWGHHFGTKNLFRSLKKHVPFETELLVISEGEPFEIRKTSTGK